MAKGLGYVPYSKIPWLPAANFKARTTMVTNDYDSDEYEEITSMPTSSSSDLLESKVTNEWEPPLEWANGEENVKDTPLRYEILWDWVVPILWEMNSDTSS